MVFPDSCSVIVSLCVWLRLVVFTPVLPCCVRLLLPVSVSVSVYAPLRLLLVSVRLVVSLPLSLVVWFSESPPGWFASVSLRLVVAVLVSLSLVVPMIASLLCCTVSLPWLVCVVFVLSEPLASCSVVVLLNWSVSFCCSVWLSELPDPLSVELLVWVVVAWSFSVWFTVPVVVVALLPLVPLNVYAPPVRSLPVVVCVELLVVRFVVVVVSVWFTSCSLLVAVSPSCVVSV